MWFTLKMFRLLVFLSPALLLAQTFNIVIANGRVMDPESGLDGIRSIGIAAGRIAAISDRPLEGKVRIDASRLVVAPGFIDLNEHMQSAEAYELKALDGVTTALELEAGAAQISPDRWTAADIGKWYSEREGKSVINFGASAGHMRIRMAVMGDTGRGFPENRALTEVATPEQVGQIEAGLRKGLEEGALGLGIEIAYTPSATRQEVLNLFRLAAEFHRPVFVHLRNGEPVAALQEMFADALITGAPLHLMHVNSISGGSAEILKMIEGARAHGLDVTTEAYPYTAFATSIESSIFSDWERQPPEYFATLLYPSTGERLTRDSFARYRQLGGTVVRFSNTEERIRAVLKNPLVMIASDGIFDHPRGQGTYARVLGRYVREEKVLTLMDAIRKCSLMPAQRLESMVPEMRRKGRIRVGGDADIVIFDPAAVIDKATYENPKEASVGFRSVLVGGEIAVQDGKLKPGVLNGKGIRAH
jgi:N-acyl-D-aspartate/D-glutamate deacylase